MDRITLGVLEARRGSHIPFVIWHTVGVQDECASHAQVWVWGSTPECPSINMSIQSLLFFAQWWWSSSGSEEGWGLLSPTPTCKHVHTRAHTCTQVYTFHWIETKLGFGVGVLLRLCRMECVGRKETFPLFFFPLPETGWLKGRLSRVWLLCGPSLSQFDKHLLMSAVCLSLH